MGRITIHDIHITDDADSYGTDNNFIPFSFAEGEREELEEKYSVTIEWQFDEYGDVEFGVDDHKMIVTGNIDDHVKVLLEIAQKHNRQISGAFNYTNEQWATWYYGVVYVRPDFVEIYEFDAGSFGKPEIRKITI